MENGRLVFGREMHAFSFSDDRIVLRPIARVPAVTRYQDTAMSPFQDDDVSSVAS
jgi:hypothetical protein